MTENTKGRREVRKFYPLGDDFSSIKVGLQFNFDLPLSVELEQWVADVSALNKDLVTWVREKSRVHVARPALSYRPGNIFSGGETIVTFPGENRTIAQPLAWLLFRRKNPEHFAMCGRNGPDEKHAFGFSMFKRVSTGKGWGNETLQPLAFPGKTPTWNPLFIKTRIGDEDCYIIIEAESIEGGDVLVRVNESLRALVPPHLKKMRG